jgi:5-methylcytosine-specific restriction enzyme A
VPSLPLRPCSAPGCGNLTSSGRCTSHQRSQDRQRGKTVARGYDADHKRLRINCFERDGWRCVDCGWEPDIVRQFRAAGLESPPTADVLELLRIAFARNETHLHADHQIPIAERPDLRLDLDNLRTRCNRCHNSKTAREMSRLAC